MAKTYSSLPTIQLTDKIELLKPLTASKYIAHIDDPAINVMTDFNHVTPKVISPNATISKAANEMKACQTHSLLVVDEENNSIIGLITTEDILGEKTTKLVHDKRIPHDEIKVKTVMIEKENVLTIDKEKLNIAKVGHLITTFKEHKQHYALVVAKKADTQQQTIIGLLSASEISRRMGVEITDDISWAKSLADLQHGSFDE